MITEERRMKHPCLAPDCSFEAGHENPHGRPVIDGEPCRFCGEPNPCGGCWTLITLAMFKGLCAAAGRDTHWR